ncbi:MAG: hypothetical protein OEV64_10730 [Desulfobulbaceae bacterium]|nr:hypothetical protein [Desulfobulbaceae bacterium]
MDLHFLKNLPPWEFPEEIQDILLSVLNDPATKTTDKLLAVELAGSAGFLTLPLAKGLITLVDDECEDVELRSMAAIALGPTLEMSALDEYDNPYFEDFDKESHCYIKNSLNRLHNKTSLPIQVRRSILEASVRDPQDWHKEAVLKAYDSDDPSWRITAVFCMGYIAELELQIMEALNDENSDICFEAIIAAGSQGLHAAWPLIFELQSRSPEDKDLLLTVIDAAGGIATLEARHFLSHCLSLEDEEIVEAAQEALSMMTPAEDFFDDYYENDDIKTH